VPRRIVRALLLVLLAITVVAYAAYRGDIRAARARVLSGSSILQTQCGPIEGSGLDHAERIAPQFAGTTHW
jgi:hypothetical protein